MSNGYIRIGLTLKTEHLSLSMSIILTRRISQIFFFLLFLWFSIVTTLGEAWWQLRGWPVNWLLELDPLVGLGTLLATGTLYAGLLWGLLTILLTIVLGRFFCGWVCPFGALHQAVGWLGNRKRNTSQKIKANRYRRGQTIKYVILIFLLGAAVGELIARLLRVATSQSTVDAIIAIVLLLCGIGAVWVNRKSWQQWIFRAAGRHYRLGDLGPFYRRVPTAGRLAANRPAGPDSPFLSIRQPDPFAPGGRPDNNAFARHPALSRHGYHRSVLLDGGFTQPDHPPLLLPVHLPAGGAFSASSGKMPFIGWDKKPRGARPAAPASVTAKGPVSHRQQSVHPNVYCA